MVPVKSERREALLMCVTALLATANWLWVRRRRLKPETKQTAPMPPP